MSITLPQQYRFKSLDYNRTIGQTMKSELYSLNSSQYCKLPAFTSVRQYSISATVKVIQDITLHSMNIIPFIPLPHNNTWKNKTLKIHFDSLFNFMLIAPKPDSQLFDQGAGQIMIRLPKTNLHKMTYNNYYAYWINLETLTLT